MFNKNLEKKKLATSFFLETVVKAVIFGSFVNVGHVQQRRVFRLLFGDLHCLFINRGAVNIIILVVIYSGRDSFQLL